MLFTERGLTVRAVSAGIWTTRLSQGRTVTTRTPAVPAPITPARWEPAVEDWYPGPDAARTDRVRRSVTLDTLKPWSQIPEPADSAGIGCYCTTVTLPAGWSQSHGA
ncbi:hypothetical protein OHT57_03370 [Streptomyces sp. NBC_00285]|uniref:hypothetical protein n=1 Tax=Streptomyces sp. NBC_00285 TaxID=2975700 RepID=UPI002E2D1D72|nr:hypothetical protein [Streptomyces sp. NBC_00285]